MGGDEGNEGDGEPGGARSWVATAAAATAEAIKRMSTGLGSIWGRVTGKRGRAEEGSEEGTEKRRRVGDG